MDQESHNFQTLESILNRIGASNYQQLALFDKQIFLQTQSTDILYQQKDYLYYLITKKRQLEIGKLNMDKPIKLQFTKFHWLNEYLEPPTWNLEIIGPSLNYKTTILKDLAETMSLKNIKVLYVSVFEHYISEKFKVIIISEVDELFILISTLLESQESQYQLIIIDGLSSLLYQLNQLGVVENQLLELHSQFSLLQRRRIQVVISSVSKMKDSYFNYNQTQDQFINEDKQFQKSILNNPWNCMWQAQLSIHRLTETKTDYNEVVNKNTLKFNYFCFYEGKVKEQLIIQF